MARLMCDQWISGGGGGMTLLQWKSVLAVLFFTCFVIFLTINIFIISCFYPLPLALVSFVKSLLYFWIVAHLCTNHKDIAKHGSLLYLHTKGRSDCLLVARFWNTKSYNLLGSCCTIHLVLLSWFYQKTLYFVWTVLFMEGCTQDRFVAGQILQFAAAQSLQFFFFFLFLLLFQLEGIFLVDE